MKTSEIVLDQWQKEVLASEGNVLLCTGRQVGKTTIFAIKAALAMIKKETHIVMCSLTEDQAKLIIVMILDYLEKNYRNKILGGTKKPTQNRIYLRNGSTVIARPVGTTGDAFRGFTGDILYIDEASRMSQLVWDASKPTLLTTGGDIWMSSTPFGKQGYFWESFNKKDQEDSRYKVFHISSEKVIKDRPLNNAWTQDVKDKAIRLLEEERKDMGILAYSQEYLGLFMEELRNYFKDEVIDKACILKRPDTKPKVGLFLGVDIGRMYDACTYEILYRSGDNTIQIENLVRTEQPTTVTERDILYLNDVYNFNKIGIDAGAGSLGVGILDHLLENRKTKAKVTAMNNRTISIDKEGKKLQRIFKEDMYDNMLSMMEKGTLKLLDDESIINSLKSVQWELKTIANVTKVHIFGRDTHIVEGLVRAAWLAKERKVFKADVFCI